MRFTMNKLLSCRYNMDTNRVEARFEGGTTLAIDCIAVARVLLGCVTVNVMGVCRASLYCCSPSSAQAARPSMAITKAMLLIKCFFM